MVELALKWLPIIWAIIGSILLVMLIIYIARAEKENKKKWDSVMHYYDEKKDG